MDVAELLSRRAWIFAAQAPQKSWVEAISPVRSTGDGYSIFPNADGGWVFGYAERNQFSERQVFATEDEACQFVWAKIREYSIVEGLKLYPLAVRPQELAREVAAEPERFAGHDDYVVRAAVARLSANPTLLEALARDAKSEVVWRVAANPATPTKVLKRLALHKTLRGPLALNPALPPALADKFTRSSDPGVRWRAARNPAVPVATLEQLATDPNFGVRWSVAANPSTPVPTLLSMLTDEEAGVRLALALGSAPEVLAALATDPFRDVAREVARNPHTPQPTLALLAAESEGLGYWVGSNPASDGATLGIVARHPLDWVRKVAAENPLTPVDVLQVLASDDEKSVRDSASSTLASR